MEYGYIVVLSNGLAVGNCGFSTPEEARAEADEVWGAYEDDGDGVYPVDLEIFES